MVTSPTKVDANAVLEEFLASTASDIYVEVGDRVYESRPPSRFTNTSAALVYSFDSEIQIGITSQSSAVVTFKCYGGTTATIDCRRVARALHDRMTGGGSAQSSGSFVFGSHLLTQGPLFDPSENWPFMLARFQITIG